MSEGRPPLFPDQPKRLRDYRRLQNEHERVIEALSIQSGVKNAPKVDSAKASG